MASVSEPDELTLTIARHLEVDWQYVRRIEAWDTEQVATIRAAGRRAGRLLGYKIATRQSEPNEENRVVVIVVVREPPSKEDHERMEERSRLLMDRAFSDLMPPQQDLE
ncbi:MAG TPA: hypothetical protein VMV07_16985 [Streptosporangiaceae bacterium]|nr:hypothetical protein [Streptosporangiaceae bacterium]